MTHFLRFAAIVTMTLGILGGCVKYDLDEILLAREDISLTWRGEEQISYDPQTWQLSCNVRKGEYRAHDDSMANYYVIKCSERPVEEGQDLVADVEWTVATNIKRYEGARFTVKKKGTDGLIWLWSNTQKIGLVIKEIE